MKLKMEAPTDFALSSRSGGVTWKTGYLVISTHPELSISEVFRAQEQKNFGNSTREVSQRDQNLVQNQLFS